MAAQAQHASPSQQLLSTQTEFPGPLDPSVPRARTTDGNMSRSLRGRRLESLTSPTRPQTHHANMRGDDLNRPLHTFSKTQPLSSSSLSATATSADIGPASYGAGLLETTQQLNAIKQKAPAAAFARSARFQGARTQYISPRHNAEVLCTASPGPVYDIPSTRGDPTKPAPPAYSWGDREHAKKRDRQTSAFLTHGEDQVGPAAYTPVVDSVKPRTATYRFPKQQRFTKRPHSTRDPSGQDTPGPALYAQLPDWTRPMHKPAHISPQPRPVAEEEKYEEAHDLTKGRSSFITHSIRGGLATPATTEMGIGPGNYDVTTHDLAGLDCPKKGYGESGYALKGAGFGTLVRFARSGNHLEHTTNLGTFSPGPSKYNSAKSTNMETKIDKLRKRRIVSLTWKP